MIAGLLAAGAAVLLGALIFFIWVPRNCISCGVPLSQDELGDLCPVCSRKNLCVRCMEEHLESHK